MSDDDDLAPAIIRFLTIVLIFVALAILVSYAHAHDPNRSYLDKWFESLASTGGGRCCSVSDAHPLDDSDWDTVDNHYRVRLKGQWYDVPRDVVITEHNRAGHALVWFRYGALANQKVIRCFLPGTWS